MADTCVCLSVPRTVQLCMQSRDLSRGCKRARGVSSSLHGCVRVKREEKQLCLCFCMPDNAYSHQTVLLPHAPLTDTVGPSISRFAVRISFEWTRMRVTGSATVWFEGSPVIDDHGPPPRTYPHTHTVFDLLFELSVTAWVTTAKINEWNVSVSVCVYEESGWKKRGKRVCTLPFSTLDLSLCVCSVLSLQYPFILFSPVTFVFLSFRID